MTGMLVASYMTSVVPLHCYQFLYLRISSNFPFYLLVLLVSGQLSCWGKERLGLTVIVLSCTVQLLFIEFHALNTLWTGKPPLSLLLNSSQFLDNSLEMRLSFHYIFLVLITTTQVGGLTVYLTGPLPLPTPPSWLSSFFGWLLAPEPPPPPIFSGATLEVQRLQRMDQIERMMIHAYNNRQVSLQPMVDTLSSSMNASILKVCSKITHCN